MANINILKTNFYQHILELQDQICKELIKVDPNLSLTEDNWNRKDFLGNDGGGGKTRAITGEVFENGGVNTSLIHGKTNPAFAKKFSKNNDKDGIIWATGISLILHPKSPRVPSVHANFRMIQMDDSCWFGGGADLTPFYPYPEDFNHFHNTWKEALQDYSNPAIYDSMKKDCDKYFTNHHRNGEMRGVGGIFFDHFNSGNLNNDYEMVKALSSKFIQSYFPIVSRRLNTPWTEEDEDFQLHRRGRYVEFNLLHDRGTAFGLQSNGRTESILISLPARCKFSYSYSPPKNSIHQQMMSYYLPNVGQSLNEDNAQFQ
jgi:coproporphyrinogen III oxidase